MSNSASLAWKLCMPCLLTATRIRPRLVKSAHNDQILRTLHFNFVFVWILVWNRRLVWKYYFSLKEEREVSKRYHPKETQTVSPWAEKKRQTRRFLVILFLSHIYQQKATIFVYLSSKECQRFQTKDLHWTAYIFNLKCTTLTQTTYFAASAFTPVCSFFIFIYLYTYSVFNSLKSTSL